MPSKLKLSIHQPCHENWQQMTPSEQGRFCQACSKEVVDFTGMSDTEVLHYFLHHKKENVCGRLYNDQLNREIQKPDYTRKKLSWYWNYIAVFFLVLFKGNAVKAQTPAKPVTLQQAFTDDTTLRNTVLGGISAGREVNKVVTGQVIDKDKRPIAGAVVRVKGREILTVTDSNGHYQLGDISARDFLNFNAVGFCSRDIVAESSDANLCTLQEATTGLVVVSAGFVSPDYEYSAPLPSLHVAVLEIKDAANNQPVKATITYISNEEEEPDTASTNSKGIYKLRQIKEQETVRVTVSAAGYADTSLTIEGWKFTSRKESRFVFLKRKEAVLNERKVLVGGVTSVASNPLYVINGQVAKPADISRLSTALVDNIEILKPPASTIIYGEQANAGAIIITTKKKLETLPTDQKKVVSVIDKQLPVKKTLITPNPVRKGSLITLSFDTPLHGEYHLQVGTADGKIVHTDKITLTFKQPQLQVQTGDSWANGWYYVKVCDANSNVTYAGRFIIE